MADVVVRHTLETRSIPAMIDQLRFTGLDTGGTVRYGPKIFAKAPEIILRQVPVSVVNLRIEYLNEGVVRGLATLPVTLTPGQDLVISDPAFQDIAATMVSLAVDPATVELPAGTSASLTATASFNDRTVQDMTGSSRWSSSDPSVATVDAQGLAMAVAPGQAVITAQVGTFTDTATMTVTEAALVTLSVEPSSDSAPLGVARTFSARGVFTDGSTGLVPSVTWTSSDEAVATVSSEGVAASHAVGETEIAATHGATGKTASARFTVTSAVLESISISPANPSIPLGLQRQLEATGVYTDGSTVPLTGDVQWSSDEAGIATVSGGLVTARSLGSTTVRCTHLPTGVTASTTARVVDAVLVGLAVTPTAPTVPLGLQRQFTAMGTFSDSSVRDLTATVTWSSSAPSVASVSNAVGGRGLATTVSIGTAVIRAQDPLTGIEGSTTVTVTDAVLVSLGVTPFQPTLPKGVTQAFQAVGTFTDNSTQDLTEAVTWTSSSTGVLTVSNLAGSRGLGTAVATGQATLTARHGATGIEGSTPVTVTAAALVSIAVTPAAPRVPLGLEQQFTASGQYTDGTTADLTGQVTWASSDGAVASVSNASGSRGLATTVGLGSTTIEALEPVTGRSGTTVLTVTEALPVALRIAPRGASIPLGREAPFAATATFTDGTPRDVTAEVTWSTAVEAVAVVSNAPGSQGRVTALGVGETGLTAVFPGFGVSDSVPVAVVASALDAIEISPDSPSVPAGLQQQFVGIGVFSDGSRLDLTSQLTWTSSNPAAAVVSNAEGSRGLATGVAVGSTTVRASDFATGVGASTPLTVTPAILTALRVDPPAPLNAPGTQRRYQALGTYSDGSEQDLTTLVSWTSQDPAVATLSNAPGSQGLAAITGSSGQSTTLTATHAGSGLSAQATQHVGLYAFSANLGDESVSTWRVNPSTGALTFLRRLTYAYGTGNPTRARVDDTGRYLLVSRRDSDQVSIYSIRPSDGFLTEVPGSPVATGDDPEGFEIHPSNRLVVVGNWRDDSISVYRFDPLTGAMTAAGPPVAGEEGPMEFTFDATGTRMYVGNNLDASASGYSLDLETGGLRPLPGSPYVNTGFATSVELHRLGTFAYVVSFYPGIYLYSLDPGTGALSFLSRMDYPDGTANHTAIGPNPRFLYVSMVNPSGILVYEIDDDTGALTPVPGAPFPLYANVNPEEVVFSPDGRFAYTPNFAGDTISVFTHNATTGALAEQSGLRRFQNGAYSFDLTP